MNKKLVSIVLRTKNEELWIGRFLKGLKKQLSPFNIEVIIVDNNSTDQTIKRALSLYENIKIVRITKYIPGASLNRGVEAANGDYIVCISAHCVPANKDWLIELIKPLETPNVAAVYGRQIPLLTSNANDKRDLWLTFGLDDKIQKRDPFLHNANAAYRRNDLVSNPFSETMTNIEDRRWASSNLKDGKTIYYASKAVIYHDHGINQSGCLDRLTGVITMMDQLHKETDQFSDYYGNDLDLANPSCCLIIPISHRYGNKDVDSLSRNSEKLRNHFSDWQIYILPTLPSHVEISKKLGYNCLEFRIGSEEVKLRPLIEDISSAVCSMTETNLFFDYIATFDVRRWIPDKEFIINSVKAIQLGETETVIGAVKKPKPTFQSLTNEMFHMEYSGWLDWLDGFETTEIAVLDPNAFIMSQMDIFRRGNPFMSKFIPLEIDG